MRRILEKGGILSLSLMLVSTYSVSAVIPEMIRFYEGYGRSQVEQLISISSVAVTLIIILNPWISQILSDRASIVLGLLFLTLGGAAPVWVQDYGAVFVARLIQGAGVGLMNVCAIDMINQRFEGDERSALLGYRGSAETVGNVVLTLIVGRILGSGAEWRYCFLIYFFGAAVLLLYLLFVPNGKREKKVCRTEERTGRRMEKGGRNGYVFCGLWGGFFVGVNTCCTMRIPSLVVEKGIGTGAQSSLILSLMMITGVFAGMAFGALKKRYSGRLQGIALCVWGLGLAVMAAAGNLIVLGLGAVIAGFANNILITTVFEGISEQFPPQAVKAATTCALVGCNLGSSVSPYALNAISFINGGMSAPFVVFSVAAVAAGILKPRVPRENHSCDMA